MEAFTIQNAIDIQSEDLQHWKKVLKPKVYNDLVKFAKEKNNIVERADSIRRGNTLTIFICNYGK